MSKQRNNIFWSVAIVVLTLYNLTPSLNGFDTQFYILAGENLWNGHIDCLRTPVYPLLCKILSLLFGQNGLHPAMTILQSSVYLLSLCRLKHLAEMTIKNEAIRFALLLFYVSCIAPGWCNEIMTESLSISGTIIITDLVVSFIKKTTTKTNVLIHSILLLLVFLRPTFVLFLMLLPLLWLYRLLTCKPNKHLCVALALSFFSIFCFVGYCHAYKQEFGHFGATTTFVFNKIYDAHRGGYWDPSSVKNKQAQAWIEYIDHQYDGTYAPTYFTIMNHPESLVLINRGCDDIIKAHRKEYLDYRTKLFVNSFDKRLLAAVNTHSPLSAILFVSSLFLSFPVSLFYLVTIMAIVSLIIYVFRNRQIPVIPSFLILIVFAHSVGIIITTSDAFERVLLPVYPVFIVLLGIIIDKIINNFTAKQTPN